MTRKEWDSLKAAESAHFVSGVVSKKALTNGDAYVSHLGNIQTNSLLRGVGDILIDISEKMDEEADRREEVSPLLGFVLVSRANEEWERQGMNVPPVIGIFKDKNEAEQYRYEHGHGAHRATPLVKKVRAGETP